MCDPILSSPLACLSTAEGYKILNPPNGYAPIRTPARKLLATPTPYGMTPGYQIPEENREQQFDVPQELPGLPDLKPEDHQYFGALLKVCQCASSACPVTLAAVPCCL